MMHGQDVSSLEKAKEITVGSLPNGMEYFIVKNSSSRGFADFALIQKGSSDVKKSREALSSLPHFSSRRPYEFLSDNGIGYTESGYVSCTDGSVRYDFPDVPAYDSAVADSTLLMMFDIASLSRAPQAVIVSGDIDVSKVRERMELLSMTVPQLDLESGRQGYFWNPKGDVSFRVSVNSSEDIAVINVIYSTERLPKSVLGGLQPLLARTYAEELGYVIGGRLKRIFRSEEIPLASLSYSYEDSSYGPGDERYCFSVYTSSMYLSSATDLVASTLADLNAHGATADEFQDAKDKVVSAAKSASASSSDAEFVSQCASSFLYGTSLASKSSKNAFISRSRISDSRELDLFNGFVEALLDSAANLTLHYDIPDAGLSPSSILKSFNAAWAAPSDPAAFKADFSDTLSLFTPDRKKKVKLKTTSADPVSGGTMWTFSNGMKVIYRKTDSAGEFRYALMLRGGVASVPGLREGESAFVADMLGLSDVAGMNAHDFREMLSANGISMSESAGLSDFRITGSAPSSKLQLLMRSLLSMASSRTPNAQEFERYREEERLRLDMQALSPRDVNSLMDNIMRPGYYYTDRKDIDNLGDDLPVRAEKYFADLFSKAGDGLLVFVGDLPEDVLKKELVSDLGGFSTQSRIASRSTVSAPLASGKVLYTAQSAPGLVGGGEIGANVGFSAAIPFSMANHMAFRIAVDVIRKSLVRALAESGAYVDVEGKVELYPTERMSVFVNCRPCREDGLPEGISPMEPMALMEVIRTVTDHLGELEIPASELAAYRNALQAQTSSILASPEGILDATLVRYSENKDVVTGQQAAIKAVTVESVRKILSALQEGAGTEYVIL